MITKKAVEEKKKEFQLLFETMNLGVTFQDNKGNITDANPAALKILGLTLDQKQGENSFRTNWKSIHEDGSDYPRENHPSMLALKTGKPILNKVMGIVNSNEKDYKWVKINAIPQFNESEDKPHKVYTTFDDITTLKEKELKLKETKNKFIRLLKNSSNSILFARLSDYKIINFNDATSKLTGYSLKELNESKLAEIGIWQSKKDYIFFINVLKEKGRIKDFEANSTNKSGESRIWLISGEIILKDNEELILLIIEDITEIRKSQDELKKQIDFTIAVTENQPAAIVACNEEGKLILFNKAAKDWHGIDVMKIPQEKWAENYGLYNIEADVLLDTHEIPLIQTLNNKQIINKEIVIKAKNQKPRFVSCNGASFSDSKGNKLGALVVMNDITQQKLIERDLKRRKQKIKEVLKEVEQSEFLLNESGRIAKIGAWELDLATQKVRWSNQVFKLHALPIGKVPSLDEAIGYYVDGSAEILKKAMEESIADNKKWDLELRLQNANKEKLWIKAIGYPISNKEGEVTGLRGVIQDITEQKLIRSKIEKSQEMEFLLANNTTDIICLQEEDSTFKYITPSIKSILGYEQSEFIGKKIFSIVHKNDLFSLKKVLKDKNQKDKFKEGYPFRVRHKNGHFVWLESSSSPVFKSKEKNYFVTSARDITESVLSKKRIQKLTNEITSIEEKQKKEIASNIHDHLSQSLVISKMKINQLKKKSKLNIINNDLEFIESHISEALENSRKITQELSPPILYQLGIIEALNWLLENLETTHKIKFKFNTKITSIKLSELKSIILYRSIQEVLTNAIKYAKASKIILNLYKSKEDVIIDIVDDGVGFNTSILNNLKNHSGSGFGLFTAQERVRNIQGEFSVTSEINTGTIVKILIPLSE
ncbi:MAG: PAS domain S-box protein [Polaribacter sp.]|uniref:PAS domain S-box protein n=1 Tax=Polaribacter sp. TaxID=1920175 RepID=UPI003263C3AA